ncbi:MAG: serine/threonine-protein phosphatase [Geodermatophilaceae bacterium]|nr:serine/threonine-protein phosphatase [Geodermatophilaceae bacterium]
MTPPAPARRWLVGAHSRLGSRRETNMDAFAALPGEGIVVLADGMGSTPRGGEAARLAVERFAGVLAGRAMRDESAVDAAIAAVQAELVAEFAHEGALTGATTLCALVADGADLLVVNLGDSRCHRLHEGALLALTTDHTVAAHLVAVGAAEPDSPLVRRTTNHLRRYLGNPSGATADVTRHRMVAGDAVLLSTDGVHAVLTTTQMTEILVAEPDPDLAARRLVTAAVAAGGTDDASALVIRPAG